MVDVNGVGYGLAVSLATYEQLPECEVQIHLYTHTYVREDRLELFGFVDSAEREMFRLLIGVSGEIVALALLSGVSLVFALLVAYETVIERTSRRRIQSDETAAWS